MWDLPSPAIEPMSPALTGGLFTTRHQRSPVEDFLQDRSCRSSEPRSTYSGHAFKLCFNWLIFFHVTPPLPLAYKSGSLLSHPHHSFVGFGRNFWIPSSEEVWVCRFSPSLCLVNPRLYFSITFGCLFSGGTLFVDIHQEFQSTGQD